MRKRLTIIAGLCFVLLAAGESRSRVALGASASATPPLALAVFAPDPQEYAFGARHLASGMGIPYLFTHDIAAALRQPMVVMTGAVDGNFMTDATTAKIRDYIASGGIVVVDDGESAGIEILAGIDALTPSEHRYTMTIDAASGDPGFVRLSHPEERTISLGNKKEGQAVLTQGYKAKPGGSERVLARFDDGTAAIVERAIGKGRIYVTGLAYYDSVLRPQDDQAIEAGRVYDNGFEPSADVPQMIVRDWYLHFVPGAVVTDPTPDGLSGALIITHDVDYIKSVSNMLPYAKAEKSHGFTTTYFVQAKTVHDIEDYGFYDDGAKRIVATVASEGGDIGSHTVAHAPDFRTFPVGTGKETPENYKPFVKVIAPDHSHGLTIGATVTGEVHVSQERLDAASPLVHVDALRTGYLLINREQWTVLERYGYRFDSSYAAGEVMTAYPYVAMEEQGGTVESRIVEFPIVLADADGWVPMLPHMAAFDAVLDDEADIHGVVTTLIHPDVVADKLPTELALVEHARPRMWVGDMDAFGDFWVKRSQTVVTGSPVIDGREQLTVTSPHGVDGLTLDFPAGLTQAAATGTTARITRSGTSVVLGDLSPGQTITLSVTFKSR
ncbi:MAG TPA: hypothetical protein VFO25_05945 [Candidatus Eremiobacteraceae bacterium]|nr:hypothetical protein [Candidatus Eremiobacteraceae bacterium]